MGYGRTRIAGRSGYIHKIVFEAAYGPIPEGMVVRHRCDNAACYRLSHLELGTQKENVADAIGRDRHVFTGRVKYTERDRQLILEDPRSSRELAQALGISDSTIRKIRSGTG